MTCIVGVTHNGIIYMGADSCGSNGVNWQTVGNHKVFEVDGFLIGCTSSFRMIDILTYGLSIPRTNNEDDDRFMRTAFIDAIKQCFKDGDFDSGGNFLVGFNGNLYEVQKDYSVLNCPKWGCSVGSGEDAARGSLFTTMKDKNPTNRVNEALEAAEAVISSVRGPMIILTTEEDDD